MDLVGYSEEVLMSIEPPEQPSYPECEICYGECICSGSPS